MRLLDRLRRQPTVPAKAPLPRTQDKVPILRADRDVLILRDGGVAAAVRVSSMDDALLSEPELRAKLDTYREDLLKHLRFDVQLLIGTRPQNLDPWQHKLLADVERLDLLETRLMALEDGLPAYAAAGVFSADAFGADFGFVPDDLIRSPGQAHDVAWLLCTVAMAPNAEALASMSAIIAASIDTVAHWRELIVLRSRFVREIVASSGAQVRTITFVTSAYPRLTGKVAARLSSQLTDAELTAARHALDRRCEQLVRGLGRMGLSAERVGAGEMVEVARNLYGFAG